MFIAGPEVSFSGSPTVSPTTAALWTSEPLPPRLPFSTYFLALSQAPPAFAIISAIITQQISAPPSMPPSAFGPRPKPMTTGARTASEPGRIIRRSAARVAMSTQRAVSGLALPSRRPGISLNWRRTSTIMSKAASPTAVMVIALTMNGKTPPMNMPTRTIGSLIARTKSGLPLLTLAILALIRASAASAAALMAKPLPIAAVELPTSSSESVISRVLGPISAISAMPPALSATGP